MRLRRPATLPVVPTPATTSAWEFEQQREVARILAKTREIIGRATGSPPTTPSELDWTERVDNTDLGYRSLREPPEEIDFDELDAWNRFYGPNGGYWK